MAGRKHKQQNKEYYEIDYIVGDKEESGKVLYKVHWKGYGHRHDTWEPESGLIDCQVVIDEYKKSQKAKDSIPSKDPSSAALSSDDEGTPKRTRAIHKNDVHSSRSRTMPHNEPQHQKRAGLRNTRDYTPGRYYFRNSTLSQRGSETAIFSSDDEPETSLSRRKLHKVTTKPPDTPIIKDSIIPSIDSTAAVIPPDPVTEPSPKWLQLGFAELIICLGILAIIVGILYYYSDYFLSNPMGFK